MLVLEYFELFFWGVQIRPMPHCRMLFLMARFSIVSYPFSLPGCCVLNFDICVRSLWAKSMHFYGSKSICIWVSLRQLRLRHAVGKAMRLGESPARTLSSNPPWLVSISSKWTIHDNPTSLEVEKYWHFSASHGTLADLPMFSSRVWLAVA